MCRLQNIAMHDYQESVTTGQTDRQTPDKVMPMCRYASQATQKGFIFSTDDATDYATGLNIYELANLKLELECKNNVKIKLQV